MVGDILQPTHLLFVLVVALLVLGPKRLPEVAKTLGNGLRDFRSALSGDSRHDEDEHPRSFLPSEDSNDEAEAPLAPASVVHEPEPASVVHEPEPASVVHEPEPAKPKPVEPRSSTPIPAPAKPQATQPAEPEPEPAAAPKPSS